MAAGMSGSVASNATPITTNGAGKPPRLYSSAPSGGPSVYPAPVTHSRANL
jgi:hypothetical protein